MVQSLVAQGMLREDAEEWSLLSLPDDTESVTQALQVNRVGMSPAAFTRWCMQKARAPATAYRFRQAGFTEQEAAFETELLDRAASKTHQNPAELADLWLDCPLSPTWICRALAVGITQPHSVQALAAHRSTEPWLIKTLDITADFRGASNRDLHVDHATFRLMGVRRPLFMSAANPRHD